MAKAKITTPEEAFIPCTLKQLPLDMKVAGAEIARNYNPANAPRLSGIVKVLAEMIASHRATEDLPEIADPDLVITPVQKATMTKKYWGPQGITLTVAFPFDSPSADLQVRIVQHMNAWSEWSKVKFILSNTDPQVRIARTPGQGYYSFLGPDILSIPRNQPTMNLDSFTMNTPESEFHRVVRHETGHTLGMPHEHMRPELVARLNVQKTIAYFAQTQGWSATQTKQQVLTPLTEASIFDRTPLADQDSIMTYMLPGSITIDGQPIRGGVDIDTLDAQFIAKMYPKDVVIAPPPPVVTGDLPAVLVALNSSGVELARYKR